MADRYDKENGNKAAGHRGSLSGSGENLTLARKNICFRGFAGWRFPDTADRYARIYSDGTTLLRTRHNRLISVDYGSRSPRRRRDGGYWFARIDRNNISGRVIVVLLSRSDGEGVVEF